MERFIYVNRIFRNRDYFSNKHIHTQTHSHMYIYKVFINVKVSSVNEFVTKLLNTYNKSEKSSISIIQKYYVLKNLRDRIHAL